MWLDKGWHQVDNPSIVNHRTQRMKATQPYEPHTMASIPQHNPNLSIGGRLYRFGDTKDKEMDELLTKRPASVRQRERYIICMFLYVCVCDALSLSRYMYVLYTGSIHLRYAYVLYLSLCNIHHHPQPTDPPKKTGQRRGGERPLDRLDAQPLRVGLWGHRHL